MRDISKRKIQLRLWPGNDLSDEAIWNCAKCGRNNLCDVCHIHDEVRGDCSVCRGPEYTGSITMNG